MMERPAAFAVAEAAPFEDRLVAALGHGAVMLMVSVGYRTGLFDAMAGAGPVTSSTLASRAGLHERYVREWLGAMAASHVVSVDDEARFTLPDEHAAWLTRAAGPANLSVLAQYIGVLGAVEDDIVACFRNGGGVPYERFGRFHEVMADDSGMSVLPALNEDGILGLVPGLADRLRRGVRVLDVGCGRGRALLALAEEFPASRFDGIDLSTEAIEWARTEAAARGMHNVSFDVRDATDFDITAPDAAYDVVFTFDAVHDQARPLAVLKGIRRAIRSDGVYIMQDIHGSSHVHENVGSPLAALLYTVSCMHCMTVSLAQGGDGLGAMWGRQKALEMLGQAGFGDVDIRRLPHDIQNDFYIVRP
ncbi:MAG TPA: class I SAM-dependent methyltransferase [Longimicrobiales bacterium]|nr:class I SAM-dependent methyltransferase [Longimicrobiales bacterium]